MNKHTFETSEMLRPILVGGKVHNLKIGYSTAILVFNHDRNFLIDINNAYSTCAGENLWIDSGDASTKGVLIKLYDRTVNDFKINEKGQLEIYFDSSAYKVLTKESVGYETWEIWGPDSLHIIGLADGEIAVFDSTVITHK